MPIPPIEYWKPNIQAIIRDNVYPETYARWDEESESYYFPDDWQQYDQNDLERICCIWWDLHPDG